MQSGARVSPQTGRLGRRSLAQPDDGPDLDRNAPEADSATPIAERACRPTAPKTLQYEWPQMASWPKPDPSITGEAFERYKYDVAYSVRSDERRLIAQILALQAAGDTDLAAAQKVLARWDGRMDVGNRSAALAQLTAELALAEPGSGRRRLPVRAALGEAINRLRKHFGRLDPTWGEVNRLRRGASSWPLDGGRDTFRAAWGKEQDDGTITVTGGDCLILFVRWDRDGRLSSRSIHQFGSATLDPASPHYADQAPFYVGMKTKPILFTEEQLRGQISRDYTPRSAP